MGNNPDGTNGDKKMHARTSRSLALSLALFAGIASYTNAHADPIDPPEESNLGALETLAIDDAGNIEVNGVAPKEHAEKPADVYADVDKVIQDAEGNVVLYLRPFEAHKMNSDGKMEKLPISGEARPFSVEKDWKMFDAEGAETLDARYAQRVIMPFFVDMGAAMFDVKWNECSGTISGNYTGLPCNKNRGLSDEYMAYLKQHYLPCVNEGLRKVGLAPASSVHITHDGTTADARHSGGSLHSAGRAIDVQMLTTFSATGGSNRFDFRITSSQPQSRDRKFYEGFRQCWGKLQAARGCPGRHSGPVGTIGWEDAHHKGHHLHTSMPFCPNNRGYFITQGSLKK